MASLLTTAPVSRVYEQILALGQATQANCQAVQAAAANGPVSCNLLMPLVSTAARLVALLASVMSNTALAAALVSYTQMQMANPAFDVAGDVTASLTALQALVAALMAEYPKSADGSLADRIMDNQGNVTVVDAPAQSLPTTLPAIAAWLATQA
jgi:hypothetical protein